jgi:glycosyltransferase involved in cell wall biosynthesis
MLVLMITQRLDERDWLVSVIPRWVNGLAQHVDALDVVALEIGQYTPPPNVCTYTMGKEHGRGKFGKMLGFYRAVISLIGKADAVFVHMIPRYVVMVGPLALLARKPLALWYTHRHASLQLRLALPFCRRVMTASPDSFPLPTDKLRVLGHGIDTDFYSPQPQPLSIGGEGLQDDVLPPLRVRGGGQGEGLEERPAILHVARLMPIKHQKTLLRALASGIDAQVVLVGDVPQGKSAVYGEDLKALAYGLGIDSRVTFAGGLPPDSVRDWYRRAAIAVNLSPPGLFDKAALESMAAGTPTIVSNPAFDSLLGDYVSKLRIDSPEDVEGLAARLLALLALDDAERRTMGLYIRERVIAAHGLERLMPQLVNMLKTGEP